MVKAIAQQQESLDAILQAVLSSSAAQKEQQEQLATVQANVAALQSVHATEVLLLKNSVLDAQRQVLDKDAIAFDLKQALHSAQAQVSALQQQLIERENVNCAELTKVTLELQTVRGQLDQTTQPRDAPRIREAVNTSWQRAAAKRPRPEELKKVSFQFSTPPDEMMSELDALQRTLPFRNSSRTSSPIQQPSVPATSE